MSELFMWVVAVFIVIDFVVLIGATMLSSKLTHRHYIEGEDL